MARLHTQGDKSQCAFTGMRTYDRGRINTEENTSLSWSNTTVGGRCLLFGEGIDHAFELSGGFTRFQNDAGTAGSPGSAAWA